MARNAVPRAQPRKQQSGAAPKKQAQPKPRARNQRTQTRLRGARASGVGMPHHSTLNTSVVPVTSFQGDAFPLRGLARKEITTTSTTRTLVFCTNIGSSGTCLFTAQFDAAGGLAGGVLQVYGAPLLSSSDVAGGPTSVRAMKCGLSMVNRTQLLSRGGPVYFLNSGQRLLASAAPSAMTATQWNTLFDSIVTHPAVRPMDLAEFGNPRYSHTYVVDQPAYNDFQQNLGFVTADQFFSHIAVWSGLTDLSRPMSTLIYALDTTSATQTLMLSATVDYYTRWPLNTVAGQAQKAIPVVDQKVANRHDAVSHKMASQDPYYDAGKSALDKWADDKMKELEQEGEGLVKQLARNGRLPRALP